MTPTTPTIRQHFESPQSQDTLLLSIPQLPALHSKVHEYSEAVKTCLYVIDKLNLEHKHYNVACVSFVYTMLAQNSGCLVGASPYICQQLESAWFVDPSLLDECHKLSSELEQCLQGVKPIMPSTPEWSDMRMDADFVMSSTLVWIKKVLASGELDAFKCSPSQLQAMGNDLKNIVEEQIINREKTLRNEFQRLCNIIHDGNVEEAVSELRNKLREDYGDTFFVKKFLSMSSHQRSSWTKLVFITRNNMKAEYCHAADVFVKFLAEWQLLEQLSHEPLDNQEKELKMMKYVKNVATSPWFGSLPISKRQAGEGIPTRIEALSVLACVLYEMGYLESYGQYPSLNVANWSRLLDDMGIEGINSRRINEFLCDYRSQIDKRQMEDFKEANYDTWKHVCDEMRG